MVATVYNVVICSLIMFGSVCCGGNISKFDRGRLEKIVIKGNVAGKPLDSFKTLYGKRLLKKPKKNPDANIKCPYTPD